MYFLLVILLWLYFRMCIINTYIAHIYYRLYVRGPFLFPFILRTDFQISFSKLTLLRQLKYNPPLWKCVSGWFLRLWGCATTLSLCSHWVVSDSALCGPRHCGLPLVFSRQGHWSGVLLPAVGNLPSPGTQPASPALAGAEPLGTPVHPLPIPERLSPGCAVVIRNKGALSESASKNGLSLRSALKAPSFPQLFALIKTLEWLFKVLNLIFLISGPCQVFSIIFWLWASGTVSPTYYWTLDCLPLFSFLGCFMQEGKSRPCF